MRNIDDYFQEVAFSMGYKPEDLLPIDRQVIELQSTHLTKGMTPKQKEFYLNKKMTTLLQRQNHIFQTIEQEIKRRQFTYKLSSDNKSKLHNPTVMKLLEDHERIMKNNKRYIDTIFRKKTMDQQLQLSRRRTLSNQRQRKTGQSFRSNASSVSSRSNRSKQSVRSNLSAASNRSSASNKERLEFIKSKKKQEEQLKKKAYQKKQQQDSKKFLRAMQNISRKSQRIKTKTAVSKQIVDDNKKELDFIKNAEIKDHLQRLKFKIQRTQMIRAKNSSKRESRDRSSQGRGLKEMLEEERRKEMRQKMDQKQKTASIRGQNQEIVKKEARTFNKMMHDVKYSHVKKNRETKHKEEEHFLYNVQKYEQERLKKAEIKRHAIQNMTANERYFTRQIKHDLAHRNIESVHHRRQRESEQLRKKLDNRFSQIKQIDEIKQKLTKKRQQYKKDLTFERKSLEVSKYRPKFNSFFDI